MNRRQHARYACLLIAACGGLEEAARACRVGKTQLGEYQSPHGDLFMPADVIADLERYCGAPIYSRVLFELRPDPAPAGELVGLGCEVAETAIAQQREIRLAAADGVITPTERERLCRLSERLKADVRRVDALLNGDGA